MRTITSMRIIRIILVTYFQISIILLIIGFFFLNFQIIFIISLVISAISAMGFIITISFMLKSNDEYVQGNNDLMLIESVRRSGKRHTFEQMKLVSKEELDQIKDKISENKKKNMERIFDFMENCYLKAIVDVNGKQNIKFGIKENITKEIVWIDSITCIHTAILKIPIEEFIESYVENNESEREIKRLYEETLNIRSTEELHEVKLSNEDKFFALCSYVDGICKVDFDSIFISHEIEEYGHLNNDITCFLLSNLIYTNKKYISLYLDMIQSNVDNYGYSESYILNTCNFLFDLVDEYEDHLSITYECIKKIIIRSLEIGYPIESFFYRYSNSYKYSNWLDIINNEIDSNFSLFFIIAKYYNITSLSKLKDLNKALKKSNFIQNLKDNNIILEEKSYIIDNLKKVFHSMYWISDTLIKEKKEIDKIAEDLDNFEE